MNRASTDATQLSRRKKINFKDVEKKRMGRFILTYMSKLSIQYVRR